MAMYETIFILDSLLTPEEIDKSVDRIKEVIESNDGKVLTVDKWGKRRMAYEIQKKQYGFYVAIEFEAIGNIPVALQNEYNYNDKVLRYLTYRYTKNKVKARKIEMETKKSAPEGLKITEEAPVESPVIEKTVKEVKEVDNE
jgi:small subunit ribosomal protein S6